MKIQTKLIGLLSFCGCIVLVSVAINWIGLSKLSADIAEMTEQDHMNSEHMIDHMEEMQTLHRNSQTLINIVLTVCMISIVTAVILGIVIIRDIVNSLNKAVAIAKEISGGNLTPQVEFTSDDEIGQLLKTLKFMTINLSSLMSKVQQSGFQITRSTKQMAASGKQLEATVTEQLASTNQVTATAQTIAATSEELVKTMDQVAQLVHRTAHGASQSQIGRASCRERV